MSQLVFPTLRGLGWSRRKTPEFKTSIQQSVSGRESHTSYRLYPMYRFRLKYDVLRFSVNSELQQIMGLFLAMRGAFDSFLFTDPDDSSVTDMGFGTRDGVATQFQLTRTYGFGSYTFVEPVMNVNVLTNVKSNGVTLTNPADYTISNSGLVTLSVPGTAGHALTWTGTYYFRCRFEKDEAEFNQFMKQLWEYQSCDLRGSLQNKV